MLSVLIFLLGAFQHLDHFPKRDDLSRYLKIAGFDESDIQSALNWFDELSSHKKSCDDKIDESCGIRVYTEKEHKRLPLPVRALIQSLENQSGLTAKQRELMIDQLLNLPDSEISVQSAKLVGLMVMWSQKSPLPVMAGENFLSWVHCEPTIQGRGMVPNRQRYLWLKKDVSLALTVGISEKNMPSNLLVVESPAKAKTLKKYLGNDFEIVASYGHVRDLVPKNGAVDVEHGFSMMYQDVVRNAKHIKAIALAARQAKHIYLATDPDREGEAIAWHISEILKKKKLLKDRTLQRLVFYEITKQAVLEAVANPRDISQPLVEAQQARRALDYLVGFNLSPLLWKTIRRGLSAGRVQSPALRLICEREEAIRTFVPKEYWTIHLNSHKEKQKISARLVAINGKKIQPFDIPDESAQTTLLNTLAGDSEATVSSVKTKKKTRHAGPPFTTSTLQQEAAHKLGMHTDKIMRVAQQLYEGVDIGGQGTVGLITYMRTDSVALAQEAIKEIRQYIQDNFDSRYLPDNPPVFKNKSKNAQEAHEAVRPTSVCRTPETLRPFLSNDQYKLYDMIWRRTVASQMAQACFDGTAVDIRLGNGLFRATGQVMLFPGFLAVYEYQEEADDKPDNASLPALFVAEKLPVDKLYGEQHFTQPLPRFSEALLVKSLEEYGIGRPSTYVSIISTLKARDYVVFEKKRFMPTDTGEVVNKFLTKHFEQYVDYYFTAHLEDELDDVANGARERITVIQNFWDGFSKKMTEKANLTRAEVTTENLDEACPQCGKQLTLRLGRRGRFVGCSGYPDCDYTRNVAGDSDDEASEREIIEGRTCPDCGSALLIKKGPYNKFIGCSSYPACKYNEPLEKPKDTGITCPLCQKGTLLAKKSRYGKLFYGCSTYPACQYATWDLPIEEACPQCNWPILTHKTTKRWGEQKKCPQKECGYTAPMLSRATTRAVKKSKPKGCTTKNET